MKRDERFIKALREAGEEPPVKGFTALKMNLLERDIQYLKRKATRLGTTIDDAWQITMIQIFCERGVTITPREAAKLEAHEIPLPRGTKISTDKPDFH